MNTNTNANTDTRTIAQKTSDYRKTKKGRLIRIYDNMVNRTKGGNNRPHLYAGKKVLMTCSEFTEWGLNRSDYNKCFENWEDSGYQQRMVPSPDRIDRSKGYSFDNIRFVPYHVNCRLGAYQSSKVREINKLNNNPNNNK